MVWALAIAALLFAATVGAIVYVYGLPTAITSLLSRNITEPTSEDYAAYSAFVDDFFSSKRPGAEQFIGHDVYIASETLEMKNPGSLLPLDVAALGPSDMGEDFFRQNGHTWQLQPRFHTRMRIRVDNETSRSAGSYQDQPPCVLQLSRIGFNRRRSLALIYYSYRCSALCCSSGWVVLQKAEGNWHIKQFGAGFIY
jgi:hypothetical protein